MTEREWKTGGMEPRTTSIQFEGEVIHKDAFEALFGGKAGHMPAVGGHSLQFEQTIPGDPTPPVYRTGWWARLTGANRRLRADYEARVAAWEAAGRPDRVMRTVIPKATLSFEQDPDGDTISVRGHVDPRSNS